MILTLEVTGQQALNLGATRRKVFKGAGGAIGRLPDNDWVLPDPYISGHHARIQFRNGQYFLEDTSTNGIGVNSPENRLQKGRSYQLKSGDRLYIDAYEIQVTVSADAPVAEPFIPANVEFTGGRKTPLIPDDPFGLDAPADPLAGTVEADPLELLGVGRKPARAAPAPKAADLAGGSPLSHHYRPPDILPQTLPEAEPESDSALIPSDYDPLAPDDMKPPPVTPSRAAPPPRPPASAPRKYVPRTPEKPLAPPAQPRVSAPPSPPPVEWPTPAASPPARQVAAARPAPTPAPKAAAPAPSRPTAPSMGSAPAAGASEFDFAAFLQGAGLQGVDVSPELAANFGQILKVVIAGLMDVLRARERVKEEFRMRTTTFRSADNNPLKFSANVEDALHNLLVKRNPGYLGPVEAFEDAFRDVRNHQMAMLAGIRVAYENMIEEFDPLRLQEDFDKQLKKGSFIGAPAKLRYWDLYREQFHDRVKDADSCFRELFGDEFAKAYEEQLEKLRTVHRSGGA